MSGALEPNGTTWSRLAVLCQREGRWMEEIDAWERAANSRRIRLPSYSPSAMPRSRRADRNRPCRHSTGPFPNVPPRPGIGGYSAFFANVARGRAMAWNTQGDVQRTISFAEATVRLRPERAQDWLELAELYDRADRFGDAKQARERAAAVKRAQRPTGAPWELR